MEGSSLDHYEKQLYSMFKSFDVNNEEALDESAVHALCDALQLEERGTALADTLFEQGTGGRVTFERFRSGLLDVLGDQPPVRPPDPPPSGAEPCPRLAFGSKRYGRRSRPALPESSEPRAASASRLEASAAPRARRSLSAAALDHHARIDPEGALALCRDLRMDALDTRIVERIFEDSPTRDATVGEFFERLDSTLARAVGGDGGELDDDARPSGRLSGDEPELGGGGTDAAATERAAGAGEAADERGRLLVAALALARASARAASRRAEAAAEERDKLRADVSEANARAALLAREVDESHSRLEREAAERLRRGEARHAEEMRRAREAARADLERAEAECARLRGEGERRAAGEARGRGALAAEEARGRRLEAEARARAEELEAARREGARLAERATAAEELVEELAARLAEGEAREAETSAALAEATGEVRRLRARVEELTVAAAPSPPSSPPPATSDANLSAELAALLSLKMEVQNVNANNDSGSEEMESDPAAAAARADPMEASAAAAAAVAVLEDESNDKLEGETNKVHTKLNDPTQAKLSEAIEAKPCEPLAPSEPEPELKDAFEERDRLRELVKDLEGALDAMRGEYEACEEYWSGKQASERAAHEAELRAADARLSALLARVAAFERRLAPPAPPLYAIPEAAALEAQVSALQAESAAAARAAAARLQRAHRRIEALQRRRTERSERSEPTAARAGCVRCARLESCSAAACARALRAETAAWRLQARLQAADVLVKELYVENCQLARHPP